MQKDLKPLSKSELINQIFPMKQALKGHQQLERKLPEHKGKIASLGQISPQTTRAVLATESTCINDLSSKPSGNCDIQ